MVHLALIALPFVICLLFYSGLTIITGSSAKKGASCKPGDRIITAGGIYGTIIQMDTQSAIIETYDGTLLQVALTAITHVA